MSLVVVDPPAVEPVTRDEVKDMLGLVGSARDDLISLLISSATGKVEGPDGIGRALITQTWELVLDDFPCEPIALPLPPLQTVVSVKYKDTAGVEQTVSPALYETGAGTPATLVPAPGAAWPAVRQGVDNVRIRFIAGYGDAGSDVPARLRHAIVLQVRHQLALTERSLFLRRDKVDGVGEKEWTVSLNAGAVLDGAVQSLIFPYKVWLA